MRSPFTSSAAPFLIALGAEALFVIYLIAARRGTIGHDAFLYFNLQYYFLSNAAASGDVAMWMPFMSHGTVSNLWYALQAGMVQASTLALPCLSKYLLGQNFLPIYYIGLLFDLCFYLIGICLLSRRLFKSVWTMIFVAVTAAGSCVYFTQPWFELHFFYALPLIFEFTHRFLEKQRWRYFLLAGNLLAMQLICNPPYLFVVIMLVVVAYLLTYVGLYWTQTCTSIRVLTLRWKHGVVPILLVGLSLACVYTVLRYGTQELAQYSPGRNPDGSVASLFSLLEYGNNSNWRWHEVLSRVCTQLDYHLYFGVLAASLALLGLVGPMSRPQRLIAVPCLFTFLMSSTNLIPSLLYHIFPLMKYYGHLSLISLITCMFLILMAGFGFEKAVLASETIPKRIFRLVALLLCTASVILLVLSRSYDLVCYWLEILAERLPNAPSSLHTDLLPLTIINGAGWCFCAAIILVYLSFQRSRGTFLLLLLVTFQMLDLYTLKYNLAQTRTLQMTQEQHQVNVIQPFPYSDQRSYINYKIHPRAKDAPLRRLLGATYWTVDSYLFTDPVANLGRTDHWLWPFDDYLRTFHEETIRDRSKKPKAFANYSSIRFPKKNAALRLSGSSLPKIQFFKRACELESDFVISQAMATPEFAGDLLFVSAEGGSSQPCDPLPAPTANQRTEARYEVLKYDSNSISINVENAVDAQWLYYADVWHPFWTAKVNGQQVPVRKANLAYKAVKLAPGHNLVEFRFDSPVLRVAVGAINLNSLLWLILTFWLIWGYMRTPEDTLLAGGPPAGS